MIVPKQNIFEQIKAAFRNALFWIVLFPLLALFLFFLLRPASSTEHSRVIVYAAQDQVYAEPILRQFEKETGLKVKAVYDNEAVKTVGLANRLVAERSHPQCDVFWGNEEMRTRQLAAQGVFRETNGWAAFGYRSRRIVINTNFVSERRFPTRLDANTQQKRAGSEIGAPQCLPRRGGSVKTRPIAPVLEL